MQDWEKGQLLSLFQITTKDTTLSDNNLRKLSSRFFIDLFYSSVVSRDAYQYPDCSIVFMASLQAVLNLLTLLSCPLSMSMIEHRNSFPISKIVRDWGKFALHFILVSF